MKKFIYIFLGVVFFIAVIYFSKDRMALDVLKIDDKHTQTDYKFAKANHLQQIIQTDKSISFELDKDNKRVAKSIDGKVVEKYLWQGAEKLYVVTDSKDNVLREYLYKTKYDQLPYGMKNNYQTYYFIYNKMKTLRVVLNDKNKIVKVLDYDNNGQVIQDTNPKLKVDFSYAGGILEPQSGLLFFVEGVYNPKIGQWISKIKNDDIIQNLQQLTKLPPHNVYRCSDTLDTYYHSYLCTNGMCGGFYATNYLNYFNGEGTMGDNSKYFNSKRCEQVSIPVQVDQDRFSSCVKDKIVSKEIEMFDALSHNCHHKVDEIIQDCKNISQRKES